MGAFSEGTSFLRFLLTGSVKSLSDLLPCKKSSDKRVLLSLRVINQPVNFRGI